MGGARCPARFSQETNMKETRIPAAAIKFLARRPTRSFLTDRPCPTSCKYRQFYPTPGFANRTI